MSVDIKRPIMLIGGLIGISEGASTVSSAKYWHSVHVIDFPSKEYKRDSHSLAVAVWGSCLVS